MEREGHFRVRVADIGMLPFPAIEETLPCAILTFSEPEQGKYVLNNEERLVIRSDAPESMTQGTDSKVQDKLIELLKIPNCVIEALGVLGDAFEACRSFMS